MNLTVLRQRTMAAAVIIAGAFAVWTYRREFIEWIGPNPGGLLFTLALVIAALGVVGALSHAVHRITEEQSRTTGLYNASLRHWIPRLIFRMPVAVLVLLAALNGLVLILALGLGKGTEIMTLRDQTSDRGTTIFVGSTRLGEIHFNKNRGVRRESEFAFIYRVHGLGLFRARADGYGNSIYAHTVVLENGSPMGPAHALHDTIRKQGRGAYSHWGGGWTNQSDVYFSTSDNTNPLENGRTYSVEYTLEFNPLLAGLILLLSLPMYVRGYNVLSKLGGRIHATIVGPYSTLLIGTACCLGLGLFIIPLFAYWNSGKTTYSLIGGLLPWSDASGWLHGTYYFLNEQSLLWWTARRPIHPAFMSFLAFITGEDLQAMLLSRTVLTGLACLLVGAEVWRLYGLSAGIMSFAVLLSYSSAFTPTTLTESLGLAMGAAGFAMTWQAVSRQQIWRFTGGLFLLSLAMSIRPGAFLVIPALTLWAAFNVGTARGNALSRLILFSSGVAAALFITSVATYMFSTGESYPGANYAYTFYGLAFGGKPWPQFFTDFPQAKSLSEVEQVNLAYRAAFAEVMRNPLGLFSGLWAFFKIYLNHLFIYIDNPILRAASKLLALVGLLAAGWRSRKDAHMSFLFYGALGVIFSAPFLFWAMDAYRAFIITSPFEAVAVSVGLVTLSGIFRLVLRSDQPASSHRLTSPHRDVVTAITTAFGSLLSLGATIAPAMALAFHSAPRFVNTTCDDGRVPFVIQLGKSSPYVEIVPDQSNVSHAPKVTFRDFHADKNFANVEIREALSEMKPGDILIHGYDLVRGADTNPAEHAGFKRFHWLIASASQMPTPGRYYLVCGKTDRLPNQQARFPVLFVETARQIAPESD